MATGTLEAAQIELPSDQDSSGRTLGDAEVRAVAAAIATGTLTATKGRFTRELQNRFASLLGVKHALACSSGTAAIHCAIAALNPQPGDEFITTPITDMGALSPILYQGAIPVFADVDAASCNLTVETIAARLSPRTRGIIVTHLFGNPCDMPAIMALANKHGIPVIEDCAQAFLAKSHGEFVGTIGQIGCFSMQQGKHITSGEGGLVTTNDPALARRMTLFVNKAWGYGDPNPDHTFLALNYRLSELQGAVALAQLEKLEEVVSTRIARAAQLTSQLGHIEGIQTPVVLPDSQHVYWRYCLNVDPAEIPGGAIALAAILKRYGIASAPRYIQKPAFACEVFREQRTFGDSRWPFTLARPEAVDYRADRFPGVFDGLERILVLPFNERFTPAHIDAMGEAIRESVDQLRSDQA